MTWRVSTRGQSRSEPCLRSTLPAFVDGGQIDQPPSDRIRDWPIYERDLICQRYNRIAAFIPFFDWALFMPAGLRKRAVDRLNLRRGDRVLEVGCGTGMNFSFLRDAVGPEGSIYGVDLSEGMLRKARKLCHRQQWANFVLIEADAADYVSQELFDGALFSFSYNTMPNHRSVLLQVWNQLRPGGRLVVVDAKLPKGFLGRLILPFAMWMMKHTLLGNPLIRAWQYHAALLMTSTWRNSDLVHITSAAAPNPPGPDSTAQSRPKSMPCIFSQSHGYEPCEACIGS